MLFPVAVQAALVPVPKLRVVTATSHGYDPVHFVSYDGSVHMTLEIKETRDRLIIKRKFRLGNKKFKRLEIFDKN